MVVVMLPLWLLLLLLLLLLLVVVVLLLLVGVRASLPPPATSSIQVLGGSWGRRPGGSRAAGGGTVDVSIKGSRSQDRASTLVLEVAEEVPAKLVEQIPAVLRMEEGLTADGGGEAAEEPASSSGAGEHREANPCGEGALEKFVVDGLDDVEDVTQVSVFASTSGDAESDAVDADVEATRDRGLGESSALKCWLVSSSAEVPGKAGEILVAEAVEVAGAPAPGRRGSDGCEKSSCFTKHTGLSRRSDVGAVDKQVHVS